MEFYNENAVLYIPDGASESEALPRTTDLCVAAHQDDIEIMAFAPIVKCFGRSDRWFTGVVLTDGGGSPRTGPYADYTDGQMKKVRIEEQKKAADTGKYSAQFMLGYESSCIKSADKSRKAVDELAAVIEACSPDILYMHNFADKHDTHTAAALRCAEAVMRLPENKRPRKIYSLEVWRGLDWLCDSDKVCLDTSEKPELARALLNVYESQIAGGKRYDSAAIGRRLANATFYASHDTDRLESCSYAADITDEIYGGSSPEDIICGYIKHFEEDVRSRIGRLS